MSKRVLNTISSNPILYSAYSPNNKQPPTEVTLGEVTPRLFFCHHCNVEFEKKPNDYNPTRKKSELFPFSINCGSKECTRLAGILRNKENFHSSGSKSFKELEPELASQFRGFTEDALNENLTLDDIKQYCHYEAKWQCPEKSYHEWKIKLSARVTNPNCPYCKLGDKTHYFDSIYFLMKRAW